LRRDFLPITRKKKKKSVSAFGKYRGGTESGEKKRLPFSYIEKAPNVWNSGKKSVGGREKRSALPKRLTFDSEPDKARRRRTPKENLSVGRGLKRVSAQHPRIYRGDDSWKVMGVSRLTEEKSVTPLSISCPKMEQSYEGTSCPQKNAHFVEGVRGKKASSRGSFVGF